MKKVVLDTNVLLVSISSRSKLHWVYKKLIEKEYTLCVTTDILAEYAEILEQHMGIETSESVLGTLENLSNVELITTYFRFKLLKDCAIASNASYIVSHDKDFNILKKIDFPKVKVIDTLTFEKEFEDLIS